MEELVKAKKLIQDLLGINAPQVSIDSLEAHINSIVDTRFREFSEEIVDTNYQSDDAGRKAELKTALTIALKKLSKKISEGSSVDLRLTALEPPKIADENNLTDAESQKQNQFEEITRIRQQTMQLLSLIHI